MHARISCAALTVVVAACAGTESNEAEERESDRVVTLEQRVGLDTAVGSRVLLEPGSYELAPGKGETLILESKGTGEQTVVKATRRSHEERMETPVALAAPGELNDLHFVLLLPEGTALESVGWIGGVAPRGMNPRLLSQRRLRANYARRIVSYRPTKYARQASIARVRIPETPVVLPSGYRVTRIAEANLDTGRRIYGFEGASINNKKQIVYAVHYNDTNPGRYEIRLLEPTGVTRTVATGPQGPVGQYSEPVINEGGQVAWRSVVGGYSSGYETALYFWDGSSVQTVANTQSSAHTTLSEPALAESGTIAYRWQTPMSSTTSLNRGINIWKNGTTTTLLDENDEPCNGEHFVGDPYTNMRGDILFWTARKSNWLVKGVFLRHADGVDRAGETVPGLLRTIAEPGALDLPHQLDRLALDNQRRVYIPTEEWTGSNNESRLMWYDGSAVVKFPNADSEMHEKGFFPCVSSNGTYAQGAYVLNDYGIFHGPDPRTDFIIREGDQISGRTVGTVLALHDVNDAGSIVFDVRFTDSGQYRTLFRADPP